MRWPRSPLKAAARLDVVDFGSGKGYLTFAMHDYLRARSGCRRRWPASSCGPTWWRCATAPSRRLGLDGLRFEEGDVRSVRAADRST